MIKTRYYYKSKKVRVRDTRLSDAFELAVKLRKEDVEEIWASHHRTPEEALVEGVSSSSLCFTIERNEKPIAIFGVVPETILGSSAIIWLLGSEDINKVSKAFIRNSRQFVTIFLDHYTYLHNWVHVNNKKSIQWLKYIGAKFDEAKPYGLEGEEFHYFNFRRS